VSIKVYTMHTWFIFVQDVRTILAIVLFTQYPYNVLICSQVFVLAMIVHVVLTQHCLNVDIIC